MLVRIVLGAAALVAFANSAVAQQVLKHEPPVGGMRTGEIVFVDNGKCGKGKILKVTGGHVVGRQGSGMGGGARTRECVPRPPGV
jgi:hypothetical protein